MSKKLIGLKKLELIFYNHIQYTVIETELFMFV